MSLDKLHIRGYQLQRIPFVPAKNTDAHSIKPAELGFLCLNDPVEVRILIFNIGIYMSVCSKFNSEIPVSLPDFILKNIFDFFHRF